MLANTLRLGLLASTAFALMAPTTYAQDDIDQTMVPEVVVTAQKREERLQEVPVAISALSPDRIEKSDIDDIVALNGFVPNLQIHNSPGLSTGAAISIRGGVTINPALSFEPTVAIYVDGAYIGKTQGGVFDVVDLERIEVLRGPQGTLYGKNSLGGAINIITRKPDGEDSASMDLTIGSYGRLNFSARGSTTLVEDKLFVSLAGTSRTRDGLYENSFLDGLDPANENQQAVRGALRWLPASNVTVDLVGPSVGPHLGPGCVGAVALYKEGARQPGAPAA